MTGEVIASVTAGFGAAFLASALATGLFLLARTIARAFRPARPPVPGQPSPRLAQAPPVLPAPAPGSRSYRAPGGADLGPCRVTIHHCDKGMVVLNHGLRTRRVIPAREESESDRAYLARLEREMGQP